MVRERSVDVLVIGAGITGLVIAHRLLARGLNVLVVDRTKMPGGVIQSETREGFSIECGPNTVLAKEVLLNLLAELNLDEQIREASPSARYRYLALKGDDGSISLLPAPTNPLQLLTTPILSTPGKWRVLSEPFRKIPKRSNESGQDLFDESVATFLSDRLGQEVVTRIAEPMFSGIWGADLNKLSARSAIPNLWRETQEARTIFRAFRNRLFRKSTSRAKRSRSKILSLKGGLSLLTSTLAERCRSALLLDTEVRALKRENGVVQIELSNGERITARKCVFTGNATSTAALIQPLSGAVAERISEIPYAPLGVLHVTAPKDQVAHPLDGFGFLAQPDPQRVLLGAIFNSSLFPDTAPPGQALFTLFCGGAKNPDDADVVNPSIARKALAELTALLGIAIEPKIIRAQFWPRAIPNYPIGHVRLLHALQSLQRELPELVFAANWVSGVSVNDRIVDANRAAENICQTI